MFGSVILEVGIGIIFVLLLVSIITTAVREGLESWLKSRAAFLEHGIREMLHDRHAVGIARSFYNHPLINGLYAGVYEPRAGTERPTSLTPGHALPTYIPTRSVALALMDIAARGHPDNPSASDGSSPVLTLANVRANVMNIENAPVQRVLLTAIDTSQGDIDKAVANIAAWYDSGMDRVSGAYKRATQKLLFAIGLAVAIVLNVNPLTIADYLYHDSSARAAIVARAEVAAKDSIFVKNPAPYREARAALDSLRLPIGWAGVHFWWSDVHIKFFQSDSAKRADRIAALTPRPARVVAARSPWDDIVSPLIGWFMTGLAATLGAPFWFDLLNKVMVVRSTVKPHEKSPEESSEDRQTDASKAKIAAGDVGSGAPAVGAAPPPPAEGAAQSGAPAASQATPAPATAAAPTDPEADVDGCDVEMDSASITADEELPQATGGVA
ncbi:MAG: hypothetical protein M3Z05_15565 [Gemmatimonadota bacterium]|nr:hypothetical protein [Gemmatimonadota bacterium]